MESVFKTFEFWNFVVAVLAILIASYSVYYTRKGDKTSIEITNPYYYFIKGRPTLITFDIFNDSKSSIKIKSVILYNSNNEKIKPLDYEPEPTYVESGIGINRIRIPNPIMPYEYASPFEDLQILGPYEKLELRYYLNPFNSDIRIKVECDRRIHWLRKSKLFFPQFKKIN